MASQFQCPRCQIWKDIGDFQPPYDKSVHSRPRNKHCYTCLYPPFRDGRSRTIVRVTVKKADLKMRRNGTIITVTPKTVTYQPPSCLLCKKTNDPMELDRSRFEMWEAGTYVQVAFAGMSDEDREVLITGTHPRCFADAFPEED